MTMTSGSAIALAALSLVLAIGFSRQRLTLLAAVVVAAAAARIEGSTRTLEATLAFAPILVLLAAALPEARWRTGHNALWLLLLAFAILLSLHAPGHVSAGLDRFLIGLWPGDHDGRGAMFVVLLAALICLVRWVLRGAISECTASIGLLVFALALAQWAHAERSALALSATGLVLTLGMLVGAYRMAFVDALSGLRNRRALDEAMERLSGHYAIAMVDIDHFKSFNDTHGHAAGDVVLREVAAELRRHSGGATYRYGGEEFSVLFVDAAINNADQTLEAARDAIERRAIRIRPATRDGKPGKPKDVRVTVSIGVADRNEKRKIAKEVMTAADKALYKAKGAGRNRLMRG
jgi:diguanylate cyclase (GGDEF)-like protein